MRITLTTLQKMAQEGTKITQLTCYDASFAACWKPRGSTRCSSAIRSAT